MKNNFLRAKLLFAAAILTTTALQTRPAHARICTNSVYLASSEAECLSICNSHGCSRHSFDAATETCACRF
jgi:hypothetical protein